MDFLYQSGAYSFSRNCRHWNSHLLCNGTIILLFFVYRGVISVATSITCLSHYLPLTTAGPNKETPLLFIAAVVAISGPQTHP